MPMIDVAAVPNTPGDCLLAFAIPTTEEAFVRDLTLGHRKDFASHAIDRAAVSTAAEGRERFRASAFSTKLIPLIDQICRDVESMGVRVARDVSLAGEAGLRSLLGTSRGVISLITHFRSSVLHASDLLDADRLAELIRSSSDPLSAGLRRLLSTDSGRDRPMGAKARERLADALNHVLRSASLSPRGVGPVPPELVVSPVELAFLNREVLDTAYASLIRPGNLVEFADGLHRFDDVVQQIPHHAGAILDLTICNSNILSDRIKDAHREWQVISNEDPASLDFRLIFHKYRIKRLTAQPPIGFIDADRELRLKLKDLAARGHRQRRWFWLPRPSSSAQFWSERGVPAQESRALRSPEPLAPRPAENGEFAR